jgi:hypothetical protein
VAGLSCALALHRRAGIDDLQVFEREVCAEATDRVGHGLILMQNGVHALRTLAVAHLLEGCTPLTRALFQDKHGVTLRTDPLRDVYCMTRAVLIDGLRAGLPRACSSSAAGAQAWSLRRRGKACASGPFILRRARRCLRRRSMCSWVPRAGARPSSRP